MFRVRAEFRDDVEIEAESVRVRDFFNDFRNFERLMPGIESIYLDGDVNYWTVRANVSLVGTMRGVFSVVARELTPERIEWGPSPAETKNLLRYAIAFESIDPTRTLVRVAERVELRRAHATELHLMAGLIGERRISEGVSERLTHMMKTFLSRAKTELEGLGAGTGSRE